MPTDDLRDRIARALRHEGGDLNDDCELYELADAALAVVTPELERRCSCDGDPIECSHEAARGQAEATVERLRGDLPAMRNALAAAIIDLAEQRQRAEQAEDRLRAATDAYARLQAQADDAEAARDRWRKRGEQAETLLADASRHLRALCHVAHDHMGANLSCAACELVRRIEALETADAR